MSLALSLYHDQLVEGGQTSSPLPPSPRLLYVRHGSAEVNGRVMSEDEAIFCDGPVSLKSTGSWAPDWRWDLAAPNLAPMLHEGRAFCPRAHATRDRQFLDAEGHAVAFSLDRIITPGGRVADRHQHPGPGIRCLIDGSFNVHQAGRVVPRDLAPGDPWWETGSDTVIAWASAADGGAFMRAMVLPVEWEGKVTGVWLSGDAAPVRRPGSWNSTSIRSSRCDVTAEEFPGTPPMF